MPLILRPSFPRLLLALLALGAAPAFGEDPAEARRVVLVVMDGLRPDFVTDEHMPTLAQLARDGVFFTRHHPVYPSSTEVNGAALATGGYPAHNGIIANREFRPELNPRINLPTESLKAIRRGDALTGGKYLALPTLPELVQRTGEPTAVAGSKGVAVLFDRTDHREAGAAAKSSVLFAGDALPDGVFPRLTAAFGPYREKPHFPNRYTDHFTTRALLEDFWRDGPPRLSVLWLSDPDFTQHKRGVGSPAALRALHSCDRNLARVLARLDAAGQRANTDVLVVSDHGFSTVSRQIDLARQLLAAGFPVVRKNRTVVRPGDILVNNIGSSDFLYVAGHDVAMNGRLVKFLQGSDFAGVIFTRDGAAGTFPMSLANFDSVNAPDVVVVMRWSDAPNQFGVAGACISDGDRAVGLGTHASLSRYDMHNTLIAAGPDFRRGFRDPLPSSNVDVAPTLAHLLGLDAGAAMDGRVLREAFAGAPDPAEADVKAEEIVAETDGWRQTLKVSRYQDKTYIDEGNGAATTLP